MASDPSQRGPSRQEGGEDSGADAEAQAWLESRLGGTRQDDFEGGLRIFCTANLRPPEAFRDVWHVVCDDADVSDDTPLLTEEESAQLNTILVVCNQNRSSEVKRLSDIVSNIDASGRDAPPIIWVPHSVAPDRRGQDNSDLVQQDVVARLLRNGLDGVVSGEPRGLRLSMAVLSSIRKSACLSRNLTDMLEESRAQSQYAQYLQQCAYETLWYYVRARLTPEVPPVDNNLEIGDPPELPGYTLGNKLGKGVFGSVYKLTENPDVGSSVQVVKAVPTEGITGVKDLMHLNRMIEVMKMLSRDEWQHPNVIRLYQTYTTPTHVLFRLEYGGPENLYGRLTDREAQQAERQRPLPFAKAAQIVAQAVEAVWHLHTRVQVCHRDIKPENIILSETPEAVTIKLADFDLAAAVQDGDTCHRTCGTLPFAAPEVLLGNPYDGRRADIWSLGVVLAEVLCRVRVVELAIEEAGLRARPEGANMALDECIRTFFRMPGAVADLLEMRCRPEFHPVLACSSTTLAGMLEVDPAQRKSADEVRSAVEQGFGSLLTGPVAPAGPAPGRRRPAAGWRWAA